MQKVILALGGNIGDVKQNFKLAIQSLTKNNILLLGSSNIIRTAPVDCPPNSPDFWNMAILIECDLSPLELLNLTKKIEIDLGRPKNHGVNQVRPIDIDIIAYANEKINLPNLTIPHPRALEREFVMIPVANLEAQNLFKREEFNSLYEG